MPIGQFSFSKLGIVPTIHVGYTCARKLMSCQASKALFFHHVIVLPWSTVRGSQTLVTIFGGRWENLQYPLKGCFSCGCLFLYFCHDIWNRIGIGVINNTVRLYFYYLFYMQNVYVLCARLLVVVELVERNHNKWNKGRVNGLALRGNANDVGVGRHECRSHGSWSTDRSNLFTINLDRPESPAINWPQFPWRLIIWAWTVSPAPRQPFVLVRYSSVWRGQDGLDGGVAIDSSKAWRRPCLGVCIGAKQPSRSTRG